MAQELRDRLMTACHMYLHHFREQRRRLQVGMSRHFQAPAHALRLWHAPAWLSLCASTTKPRLVGCCVVVATAVVHAQVPVNAA